MVERRAPKAPVPDSLILNFWTSGCWGYGGAWCPKGAKLQMEPKTLNQGQLNLAREVAVDIVQNTQSDEASNLFLEGGKAVVEIKEAVVLIAEAETVAQEDCVGEVVKTNVVIEASCQCACPSAVIDDSPEQSKLKEPLSAPF